MGGHRQKSSFLLAPQFIAGKSEIAKIPNRFSGLFLREAARWRPLFIARSLAWTQGKRLKPFGGDLVAGVVLAINREANENVDLSRRPSKRVTLIRSC